MRKKNILQSQYILKPNFRKKSVSNRFLELAHKIPDVNNSMHYKKHILPNTGLEKLAENMVESAIGVMGVPIGIVENVQIDEVYVHVPIATEEPSVIAAASFGAKILRNIKTHCEKSIQIVQIALCNVNSDGEEKLQNAIPEINELLMKFLESMQKRGGGLRGISYKRLKNGMVIVHIDIDMCDAMGANKANSTAEYIAPYIAKISGGIIISAILSNFNPMRVVSAEVVIDVNRIPSFSKEINSDVIARKIDVMCDWAFYDAYRAVTHNKGIMNAVSGLALVTGNDTRAIEAAAHALASVGGTYRPLSTFSYIPSYKDKPAYLKAQVEIPALFAVVGGSTQHPTAIWARKVMAINYKKSFHSHTLNRISAALALVQNFSALRVLVGEGIQRGHMKLHAKKMITDKEKEL